MGVQLFAGIALQENLNEHANFQSLGNAFTTLFQFTTGEAWNAVMYDCLLESIGNATVLPAGPSCIENPSYEAVLQARNITGIPIYMIECTPSITITYAYFISFTLITTFVMLNLFVAVILEGFENQAGVADAALSETDFTTLLEAW